MPGIHIGLAELVALEHRTLRTAGVAQRSLHSLLMGRHLSRQRGQGFDFLEMRHYQPGDDVRSIDWRASARSVRLHVRVHAQERDRPVLLVVDQRQNMFFATRRAMKSVIAAEAAALLGWELRRGADRIGALVFNDRDLRLFTPRHSRSRWLQVLEEIARCNQALRAQPLPGAAPAMLDRVLEQLLQALHSGHLIVLLSDFAGATASSDALVGRLAHQHALLAMPIRDPVLQLLPERGPYVVSDGARQLVLSSEDTQRIAELAAAHWRRIERWREELSVPVLALNTTEDVAVQLHRALHIDPTRRADGR